MGVTVPEVIGYGHAVGRDRDRIGVVSDADRDACAVPELAQSI